MERKKHGEACDSVTGCRLAILRNNKAELAGFNGHLEMGQTY